LGVGEAITTASRLARRRGEERRGEERRGEKRILPEKYGGSEEQKSRGAVD
jgi:hypothetical protein